MICVDTTSPSKLGELEIRAWFSEDRRRRFLLSAWWAPGPRLTWIMLNPSLAGSDAHRDHLDPTLRRVRDFTAAAGWAGFDVVNLYTLISPDPSALGDEFPAILAGTDRQWLEDAAAAGGPLVAAWGSNPLGVARARLVDVLIFTTTQVELLAVKATQAGHPGHPLYVPSSATLRPWVPPWR